MRNKNIKYTVLAALSLLILSGCYEEEFLDVLPKGVVVAKTANDFRMLLDDADTSNKLYSLTQSTGGLDVLTDDVSVNFNTLNSWNSRIEHFQGLFRFDEFIWTYVELEDDNNWKKNYYVSYTTSVILDEIERVTDNIELKKQLIAEAKVHRAYAYLSLINTYAKAYNPVTAATDLGVPIVTNPTALPSLERNTVQEVYDFILKDLLEAIEELPSDVDQYKHRPTKVSAYAVLARTYLYMGNYERAFFYANKSLQIRSFLYDLNTQYVGDYPHYKDIMQISIRTDEEALLHKTVTQGVSTERIVQVDPRTFNKIYPGCDTLSISNNGDVTYINYDLRRTLWFYGWNSKCEKISYSYLKFYGNHRLFRYGLDRKDYYQTVSTGEMYVTRAEANARLGNLQEALNDVNALAEKRYLAGTYIPLTLNDLENDQAKVIEETLKERRRELYGKGLRLFDIKRLHLPITHYLDNLKITVPADDPRFILPIFPKYIEDNPELIQNDRSVSGVVYE